jgi:hypothetical protein
MTIQMRQSDLTNVRLMANCVTDIGKLFNFMPGWEAERRWTCIVLNGCNGFTAWEILSMADCFRLE